MINRIQHSPSCIIEFINLVGEKEIKCLASLAFYLFSPTCLISSIKHEHSCKILYTILSVNVTLEWREIYVIKICFVLLCNYDNFIQSMVGGWGFLLFCLQNANVHVLLLLITVNITP